MDAPERARLAWTAEVARTCATSVWGVKARQEGRRDDPRAISTGAGASEAEKAVGSLHEAVGTCRCSPYRESCALVGGKEIRGLERNAESIT